MASHSVNVTADGNAPASGDRVPVRFDRTAGLLAGAGASIGMLFNGFNNQFGPALSCIINSALLAVLIIWRTPSAALWRRVAPVVALVVLAILWGGGLLRPLWGDSVSQWSFVPDLLERSVLGVVSGLLALVAGYVIAANGGARGVPPWLLAFGGVNLLFGFYLRQAGVDSDWDLWTATTSARRFAGTLANANVAATYAAVLILLALAGSLTLRETAGTLGRRQRRLKHLFHAGVVLMGMATLVLSASRTTTVATLAAALVLGGPRFLRGQARLRRRHLTILLAALAALVLLLLEFGPLAERFGSTAAALQMRELIWSHYAHVALSSPLHGYGLGSFSSVNAYFIDDPVLAQALSSVNSAHNILLQLAIEGGVPYLALHMGAALWVVLSVARSRTRRRLSLDETGMIAALAIVFASASVDIALDVPAMVTLVMLLAGLLWGRCDGPLDVGVAAPQLAPQQEKGRVSRRIAKRRK